MKLECNNYVKYLRVKFEMGSSSSGQDNEVIIEFSICIFFME